MVKATDKTQPLPVISDQFNPMAFPGYKVDYPQTFLTRLSSYPWSVPGLEEASQQPWQVEKN